MTEKSLIIIGAGLAGVSTGCYAQMNGYQSHIFEHHSVPGGVAACWKRKGYLIDGGIHFVMSHKPGTALYELYRELGFTARCVDMTTYGRFADEASGRALALGETEGQARMICEEGTGKVLGAHIIGPHATELIAEASLAVRLGLTAAELAHTIHAHPTLSEVILEAALGQLDGAIHYRYT